MQQRGSDKHGPLQDEELKHETEAMVRGNRPARAEEWRDPEPPADDDPELRGWRGSEETEQAEERSDPESPPE